MVEFDLFRFGYGVKERFQNTRSILTDTVEGTYAVCLMMCAGDAGQR